MSTDKYDVAVVGGGIAGLAIAEIFARSGRRVVLLERNHQLCREASASQHGWFHFGSLYSIFPQNQFLRTLVGGVEDLLAYYSGFSGMNIRVDQLGNLNFSDSMNSWFRNEPLEYIVTSRNNPDFNMRKFNGIRDYIRKVLYLGTWEYAVKQFISRHQRFHKHNWSGVVSASEWIPRAGFSDYSRDVISKPNYSDISLDTNSHFRIVGYDRPMRATLIISDLLSSLIGSGGEIKTGFEVKGIDKVNNIKRITSKSNNDIYAKTVICTAGRWLGNFLSQSDEIKVVASPLLVTYPAVTNTNFVRMTPFVEKSINHIRHEVDKVSYSVIGGGYYADPKDSEAIENAKKRLLDNAMSVFPHLKSAQILETYIGYKTEFIVDRSERNYQYLLRQVDDKVYAAIPGKFSLAFSLAANTFKLLTGESPSVKVNLSSTQLLHTYVGLTQHANIIRNQFMGSK